MGVRGVGDPSQQNNLNSLIAIEANNQANKTRANNLNQAKNTPATKTQGSNATDKPPAPQPQTAEAVIAAALEKTIEAGKNASAIFTEQLFKQGQEASRDIQANLTPRQAQVFQLASGASTQAVRQGINVAQAVQIARTAVRDFLNNPYFEKDEIAIAIQIIQDFMGGSLA